jgi:hypothetical protein
MTSIKNISGVAAPSRNLMRLHDTTYSPTGLWQFASGSIGTDAVGSFNLTQDATHGAPTEVGGYVPNNQALSDFIYYRNNASDLDYTGAMSAAIVFKATAYSWGSGAGDNYYRVMVKDAGGTTDGRYNLLLTPTGHIAYSHKKTDGGQTNYSITLSQRHYDLYRWHHLAFTRTTNGRTITIYLDGVQIHQSTLGAGPGTAGTTYFNLGGLHGYNGGAYENLTLSSAVIFDKELTATQIGTLAGHCLGF